MSAVCKFCDEPIGVLTCGGVAIPNNSPLNRSMICDECAERGDDWFHDSDMEDRS